MSLHQKDLQLLLAETCWTKANQDPRRMNDISVERTDAYNVRSRNALQLPKAGTAI